MHLTNVPHATGEIKKNNLPLLLSSNRETDFAAVCEYVPKRNGCFAGHRSAGTSLQRRVIACRTSRWSCQAVTTTEQTRDKVHQQAVRQAGKGRQTSQASR